MKKKRVIVTLCLALMLLFPVSVYAGAEANYNLNSDVSQYSNGLVYQQSQNTMSLTSLKDRNSSGDEITAYTYGRNLFTVKLSGQNSVNSINPSYSADNFVNYLFTGTPGATLEVKGGINSSNDNEQMTVSGGVALDVANLYFGSSGGQNSTLTLKDDGTKLDVTDLYLNHYKLTDKSVLNVNGHLTVTAGGSLDIDHNAEINLKEGFSVESADPVDYAWLSDYLPAGYTVGLEANSDGNLTVYDGNGEDAYNFTIKYRVTSPEQGVGVIKDHSPKTTDPTEFALWFAMAVIAMSAAGFGCRSIKKQK